MKLIKNITRVLTILFSAAAFVLFFFNFGKVTFVGGTFVVRTGTEFAFGQSYNGADIGMSSDILFCMILSAFTLLFSALSLKFKGSKWATIGFAAVDAVYMLVIACSTAGKFLDTQGFENVSGASYVSMMPLWISIALFLTLISAIANLLAADKLAVDASKGQLTILEKIVKFLRDYKGEIKKIVWPGPKAVVKNTVIVLVMCLLIGAFIWLLDLGLGSLIGLVTKIG